MKKWKRFSFYLFTQSDQSDFFFFGDKKMKMKKKDLDQSGSIEKKQMAQDDNWFVLQKKSFSKLFIKLNLSFIELLYDFPTLLSNNFSWYPYRSFSSLIIIC